MHHYVAARISRNIYIYIIAVHSRQILLINFVCWNSGECGVARLGHAVAENCSRVSRGLTVVACSLATGTTA